MHTAILIFLGAITLYLAICAFYFIFQERLIFVPLGTLKKDSKIELGTRFDEKFLNTNDGAEIHALHIKAKNPRGCILYFHGNTGHVTRWAPIAEEMTSFGFDVFLPEYRGYGKSRGQRSEKALYQDALAWYEEVLKLYPEDRICLYGRSLGSAMASWLVGVANPGGVILETPFNNLPAVAAYHTKIIPVRWFLKFRFHNDRHLPKGSSPILLAHGTKDIIVPYRLGFALFKTVQDRAEMVTIPGGHHGDLNGYPLFREKLTEFFDSYFSADSDSR